jgi:CheY-like chemotaxis protein
MNAARILVVEDELSMRRLRRLYLTKAGFTVDADNDEPAGQQRPAGQPEPGAAIRDGERPTA